MATTTNPNTSTGWARWLNIALGIWLFISAFIWPHAPASMTNTWILGLAIAISSGIALYEPPVRWINTLLAAWLFGSTLVIRHVTAATPWHNATLALVVFLVSLVPSPGERPSRRPARPLARMS